MKPNNLTLTTDADEVADRHRAFEAAMAREHVAEVRLLESALAAVRPALPALASKLPYKLADSVDIEARGVFVDEVSSGREALAILEDGRLAISSRTLGELLLTTPAEALEVFRVEEIVSRLSQALRAQLSGRKAQRTAEALTRARRFEALAELLGGVP